MLASGDLKHSDAGAIKCGPTLLDVSDEWTWRRIAPCDRGQAGLSHRDRAVWNDAQGARRVELAFGFEQATKRRRPPRVVP